MFLLNLMTYAKKGMSVSILTKY